MVSIISFIRAVIGKVAMTTHQPISMAISSKTLFTETDGLVGLSLLTPPLYSFSFSVKPLPFFVSINLLKNLL